MVGGGKPLRHWCCVAATALLLTIGAPSIAAAAETVDISDQGFASQIRPLLLRYCSDCHADDNIEAEIDLSGYATLADIRGQIDVWLKIRHMLDSRQMPPQDAVQPTDEEFQQLQIWVRELLTQEARRDAGDPGPTVLRRLNNEEYNYTVRDLTGVPSLNPTREFPVDGAAGEGFINSGAGQAMSPALAQKYLDAARGIADHLVLLPDGIAFSSQTTRRDQSDECLAKIQDFYRRYTVEAGSQPVELQGFETNERLGGVLPLQEYLLATLEERTAMNDGTRSIADVCHDRGLNEKYFSLLWAMLAEPGETPSFLLDEVRRRWRSAVPDEATSLARHVADVQRTLWKFSAVGHIGPDGRPHTWMEPASPVETASQFRIPLPESSDDVTVTLAAVDAGDGSEGDRVVWENLRLTGPGPDIPFSRLAGLQVQLLQARREDLLQTAACLAAAREALLRKPDDDAALLALAEQHEVDSGLLRVWLRYLGFRKSGAVAVSGHFRQRHQSADYAFVSGWGSPETPSIVSNASNNEVRIPGIAPPHSVLVHPSPTLFAATGWQSPLTGRVTVSATIADAHPECGNGQQWNLQHRMSDGVRVIETGHFGPGGSAVVSGKSVELQRGEFISLIIGPHQQAHSCDLTNVNLVIQETEGEQRRWDLAAEVNEDIDAANPHADSFGNSGIWHFYQGEMAQVEGSSPAADVIPPDSLLGRWRQEQDTDRRQQLAVQVQRLVTGDAPDDASSPDAVLYQQIHELIAPVNRLQELLAAAVADPRFGSGERAHDLIVAAPHVTSFRIPAALASGRAVETAGRVMGDDRATGAVRLEVSTGPLSAESVPLSRPVLISDSAAARQRVEAAFDDFRQLFAPALCYTRIVPIDEVVTITLFYRQDEVLRQLMLNEQEAAELDRLWESLLYVSQEPRQFQVAFEQNRAFATQDRPDLVEKWAPLAEAVEMRLAKFEQQLLDSEPVHVASLMEFAGRAWRRSLSEAERSGLQEFYDRLRQSDVSHEAAVKLTLARILSSPIFLYRQEQPPDGPQAAPVTAQELSVRLSYFLWSSTPDSRLLAAGDSGRLTQDARLKQETRRLLQHPKIRRLAVQFACQWLHLRGFDQNDDKNEALYPQFVSLREDMYEETVLFFEDLFRNDRSVLSLLEADHTFLNESLARHYGIDTIDGDQWQRVGRMQSRQRGGLLGMASLLASQSGASRTSPILRGNWISETLLGERLPRPPASVPQLPETVPDGLTARQLIERHSSAPECAKCHAKIDPYGFALEQYDAIGRLRPEPADTVTRLADGQQIQGMNGLRRYLLVDRRDDVIRQFCRKLLGFALGRAIQLSDEPLLDTMMVRLKSNEYRFHTAVEDVVLSPQFRQVRGRTEAALKQGH